MEVFVYQLLPSHSVKQESSLEKLKGTGGKSAAFIQSAEPVEATTHSYDVVHYDSFPFTTRSFNHLLLPGLVIIFISYLPLCISLVCILGLPQNVR